MRPGGLAEFEGTWRLGRRIEDARSGSVGALEGVAVFRPDGEGGLLYVETGTLRYGAAPPLAAERRYLWRAAGPGRIAVAFGDGRPFHDFALGLRPEATHLCAPDTYRVRYDFADWPRWSVVWTVRGPRKDYVSTTSYRPEDSGPGSGRGSG